MGGAWPTRFRWPTTSSFTSKEVQRLRFHKPSPFCCPLLFPLQVQILLDLGASLAGPAQLPGTFQALAAAAGDMPWPPTSTQQATLLRCDRCLLRFRDKGSAMF